MYGIVHCISKYQETNEILSFTLKNLSAFGQSLNINTMYMNVAYCLDTVLSNEDCTPQCYVYTVSDTSCNIGKRPGDEL